MYYVTDRLHGWMQKNLGYWTLGTGDEGVLDQWVDMGFSGCCDMLRIHPHPSICSRRSPFSDGGFKEPLTMHEERTIPTQSHTATCSMSYQPPPHQSFPGGGWEGTPSFPGPISFYFYFYFRFLLLFILCLFSLRRSFIRKLPLHASRYRTYVYVRA